MKRYNKKEGERLRLGHKRNLDQMNNNNNNNNNNNIDNAKDLRKGRI